MERVGGVVFYEEDVDGRFVLHQGTLSIVENCTTLAACGTTQVNTLLRAVSRPVVLVVSPFSFEHSRCMALSAISLFSLRNEAIMWVEAGHRFSFGARVHFRKAAPERLVHFYSALLCNWVNTFFRNSGAVLHTEFGDGKRIASQSAASCQG